MAKWLLVDGFNLVYRCFHAIPELNRTDGFPTNALHGWVKSLWRLSDQEKPAATLVFFDLGGSQEREALHADYKAQRKPMPDPLRQQIDPIKTLTRFNANAEDFPSCFRLSSVGEAAGTKDSITFKLGMSCILSPYPRKPRIFRPG